MTPPAPAAAALLVAIGLAAPAGAEPFSDLARDAFACLGPPGDSVRRDPQDRAIGPLSARWTLPAAWGAPEVSAGAVATVRSGDGRIRARLVVERLGELDLDGAVRRHEGHYLGRNVLSPSCREELAEAWRPRGAA